MTRITHNIELLEGIIRITRTETFDILVGSDGMPQNGSGQALTDATNWFEAINDFRKIVEEDVVQRSCKKSVYYQEVVHNLDDIILTNKFDQLPLDQVKELLKERYLKLKAFE